MPIPFGVGIGDFIAGIDKIIEIVKACRDVGGASDEYRSLTSDLKNFVIILESLKQQAACQTAQAQYHRREIMDMVDSCNRLVASFRAKLDPYDKRLGDHGHPSTPSSMKAKWKIDKVPELGRKAKFAVLMPDELHAFRQEFFTKIQNLHLLVTSSLNNSLSIQVQKTDKIQNILSNIDNDLLESRIENKGLNQQVQLRQALMQESLAQIVSGMRKLDDHGFQSSCRTGSSVYEDSKSTHSIEKDFREQIECSTNQISFSRLAIVRTPIGRFEYHEIQKRKLKKGNKKHVFKKGRALRFVPSLWFTAHGFEISYLSCISKTTSWQCTLQPVRIQMCEDDNMIRCLGLIVVDGYENWYLGFKPHLFDYKRARGYLESGKLHPSDLIEPYNNAYRTSVFEAFSRVLIPHCMNHDFYNEYFARLYEVFKLLIEFQKQPPWLMDYRPDICSNWPEIGRIGFAEIYIQYSVRNLFLTSGFFRIQAEDKRFHYTDLRTLFQSLACMDSAIVFQRDYIDHLTPDDISCFDDIDRCLLNILCNCMPGFGASFTAQLISYGSAVNTSYFFSTEVFEDISKDFDDVSTLLDIVSTYGTLLMLEYLSGTKIQDFLAYFSEDEQSSYCFDYTFFMIPNANFDFLRSHNTVLRSRPKAVGALYNLYHWHKSLKRLSEVCKIPDQHLLLSEFICYTVFSYRQPRVDYAKSVVTALIDKGFATENLKSELFLGIICGKAGCRKSTILRHVVNVLITLVDVNEEISLDFFLSPYIILQPSLFALLELHIYSSWTLLMLAVLCGDLELVELLIKSGAKVSRSSSSGSSAISLAHSLLELSHPREVPVPRIWDARDVCEFYKIRPYIFYTEFTQSFETDQKIHEFLQEAAMEQDDEVVPERIDVEALQRSPLAEFISSPRHFLKYHPTIVQSKNSLHEMILRIRHRSYFTYDGIDRFTFLEVLAFRTAALAVFLLCVIYNLYMVTSQMRHIHQPSFKHSWLLVLLIVGMVMMQEFKGLQSQEVSS